MYTLTIGGKAIAVTNADEEQARELFMGDDFKEDLKALESDGAPLWDGTADLALRPSTAEEKTEFEDAEMDDDEDEGPYIMFLVDVDETDEDDEEA